MKKRKAGKVRVRIRAEQAAMLDGLEGARVAAEAGLRAARERYAVALAAMCAGAVGIEGMEFHGVEKRARGAVVVFTPRPAPETPAPETPAGETPAGEAPAGETPAGET